MHMPATLYDDSVDLLKELIRIPSLSREEGRTAGLLYDFLESRGVAPHRNGNNVWAVNRHFDPGKPTILLNSHHDTVKPNPQYTRDPFDPAVASGKLFGLGSNDAGGCLVSLLGAFLHFYDRSDLGYNLLVAATAEEEISGKNGIESLLPLLPVLDCAIVGEPTGMNLAVAEKGLMVLDVVAYGRAGHAAREEGENALYKAMDDIAWFRSYHFPMESVWLGPVKMSVTVIETENKAHNVVPAVCRFTVDIRVTDVYSHEEVLEVVRAHVSSEVVPRSMRMRATGISESHPLVLAGLELGKTPYGSPTSSDKALMPFPALKCGPGDSARSHTADEYVTLEEIRDGLEGYIALLEKVVAHG
jgi:acetylornithine deacetylase/succinyl-diaminopimelate desuccinylase-like protein